jgi:integrase
MHRREANTRVRFLTEEEEKKLRQLVEKKWSGLLPGLDLAINTGLRKTSQCGLTWDMVDWESRELHKEFSLARFASYICEPVVDEAPLEDIADLLGHKSLAMTRRYAHLGPNKLQAVVSLLEPSAPEVPPAKTTL